MQLALALAAAAIAATLPAGAADRDRDGLDDALEQRLLDQFQPRFLIAVDDCDRMPALLDPGVDQPEVLDRDGSLYAQASPARLLDGDDGVAVELHYYHLWGRDCGRMPHRLDAEYVAALVVAPASGSGSWTARAWYAAAHEETVCDSSNAARADLLDAVDRGPLVWVSADKHASYLAPELCRRLGCGVDRCAAVRPLPGCAATNLGEADASLDGARWVASAAWTLAAKMRPVFTPELLERVEGSEVPLAFVGDELRPLQLALTVGGETVAGTATASGHAAGAVATAGRETTGAVGAALGAVGRSLARAAGTASDDE